MFHLDQNTRQRQAAFEMALKLLRDSISLAAKYEQTAMNVWPITSRVLPHLLSIVEAFDRAQPRIEVPLLLAQSLAELSRTDRVDKVFVSKARFLLCKADEILECIQSPNDIEGRANVLKTLAFCTDTFGISERARGLSLRKRCLEARRKAHSALPAPACVSDEKVLWKATMDMVYSLLQLGRIEEVEKICQEYHTACRHWGGESIHSREYAKYHHYMAYVFLHKADTKNATEAAKKSYNLVAQEEVSQNVIQFRLCWAMMLFHNNEREKATREHRELLESIIGKYGELDSVTLQSRLILGILYFRMCELSQAEYVIPQMLK